MGWSHINNLKTTQNTGSIIAANMAFFNEEYSDWKYRHFTTYIISDAIFKIIIIIQ
jgi:hypothetical protein